MTDCLTFEWDEGKNASNGKEHRISFDEAKTVFIGHFARLIADPDHLDEEGRFILIDTSVHSRLLFVCHCVRVNNPIRLIPARKANQQEREFYEDTRNA